MSVSDIQQFFIGKTVFVTGGTGFLGKLLIEKLLRACYDLEKIYVLVRIKKGKTELERFNDIFNKECFGPLKRQYPDFKEKVFLVNGDCSQPDLGISNEFKEQLIKEVNVIFHVAATVRFDEHLKIATHINVRSVLDLLKMAKSMKQLQSFLHVSTAYAHCPQPEILEKVYDTPIKGINLISLVDSLDDETIKNITPHLLQAWPNSYVYTKAIAEEIIKTEGKGLPIAIVRPAVVMTSYDEPIPGWIDNIYGVVGVITGAGLGLLRTMPANPDSLAEIVPCDFVINNIIAAAWDISTDRPISTILPKDTDMQTQEVELQTLPVYNNVASPQMPVTQAQFFETCMEIGLNYPPVMTLWYISFSLRPHPISHWLAVTFLHNLPAYVIDFVLRCLGRKQMAVRGYKKLNKFLDVLSYFARGKWTFNNDNVQNLFKKLSDQDKVLFNFDMNCIDLRVFLERGLIGGRVHLLKDPLDTVPRAKSRLFKLKIAHYALCGVLLILFYKLVMFVFNFFW